MQNREEKRQRVMQALTDSAMQGKSDRAIARHLGVSQPFVSQVRKALAAEDGGSDSRSPRPRANKGDNVITRPPPQAAPDHTDRHPPLTGELLASAGCSIALAGRILGRLSAMPAGERRPVEGMLVEVLL